MFKFKQLMKREHDIFGRVLTYTLTNIQPTFNAKNEEIRHMSCTKIIVLSILSLSYFENVSYLVHNL